MDLKIIRSLIPHPKDSEKAIEFFWSEPSQSGKHPLIILIHGHHPTLRLGARNDIANGMFEFFSDNGFICVSMSQPGYGCSDGPPDYCGPYSQDAVSGIISFLIKKGIVDNEKIAVQGWSRGANVAALAASKDSRIKLAILGAGLYDMVEGYNDLTDGIRKSLSIESSGSMEALIERSPIFHVEKMNMPILMIHGGKDQTASPKHALRMHERLIQNGKDVQLEMFENHEHGIPLHILSEIYGKFLAKKEFIKSDILKPIRLNHSQLT